MGGGESALYQTAKLSSYRACWSIWIQISCWRGYMYWCWWFAPASFISRSSLSCFGGDACSPFLFWVMMTMFWGFTSQRVLTEWVQTTNYTVFHFLKVNKFCLLATFLGSSLWISRWYLISKLNKKKWLAENTRKLLRSSINIQNWSLL